MIDGSACWGDAMRDELEPVAVGAQTFLTWRGAPGSVSDMLIDSARKRPHAIALRMDGGRSLTFGELDGCVEDFAGRLGLFGVRSGARVGVLLQNSLEFVAAFVAVNRAGGMMCPLPGKLSRQEVVNLARRACLDVLVTDESLAIGICDDLPLVRFLRVRLAVGFPRLEILVPDTAGVLRILPGGPPSLRKQGGTAPDDDAILMFTSGTTSDAKGVVITNRAVVHAVIAYQRVLGLTAEDSAIIAVPMYHITGVVAIIAVMIRVGGTLVVQQRFRPGRFLAAIQRERITFVHASPTVFQMLLQARREFSEVPSVRLFACGAAHMPVSWIRELHEWMPQSQFRTIYGLTETTSPATMFPTDASASSRIGASGLPIPGMSLKICDGTGAEVPDGEAGEILVRGANVARGYDTPDGVAGPADGWFHTGDIGYVGPDDYLWVVDRIKDVVNRGGEKIWCTDVEEALRAVPGVDDACVVGVPDAPVRRGPRRRCRRGTGGACHGGGRAEVPDGQVGEVRDPCHRPHRRRHPPDPRSQGGQARGAGLARGRGGHAPGRCRLRAGRRGRPPAAASVRQRSSCAEPSTASRNSGRIGT